MNVIQNSLVSIDFNPEADCLLVEWPNIEPYITHEIKETIGKVVEVLSYFKVNNLVIDANRAKININYADYLDIIDKLMDELNKTHVQKVARIVTTDSKREAIVDTVMQKRIYNFQLRSFETQAEATEWIKR